MFKKFQKGGQFAYEMLVPTVKKNLTKRRKDFEDLVKTTDKYKKNLTKEGKIKVSESVQPAAKKISGIHDKYEKKLGPGSSNPRAKKASGGMMGRRMGLKTGSNGSKKGKVPTTPKEKSLAKLAPPRNRITFGDVVAGRTKGAKNGKTMS